MGPFAASITLQLLGGQAGMEGAGAGVQARTGQAWQSIRVWVVASMWHVIHQHGRPGKATAWHGGDACCSVPNKRWGCC